MVTSLSEKFHTRGSQFLQAMHILIDCAASKSGKARFDAAKKKFLCGDVNEIYQRFEQSIALISDFQDGLDLFYDLLKRYINFLKTECAFDKKTAYEAICQAEQFAVWQKGRTELVTESKLFGNIVRQVDLPMLQLSDSQQTEYLELSKTNLPLWCQSLPLWQRNFLKKQLEETRETDIVKRFSVIPSGLRQIPGLANYSVHVLQLQAASSELLLDSYRFCAAMPSAFSVKDFFERRRLTRQNINQIFEQPLKEIGKRFLSIWDPLIETGQVLNVPVLVQSLISPVWTDNLFDFFRSKASESSMIRDKESAVLAIRDKIETKRSIIEIRRKKIRYRLNPVMISTNYPINALRKETLLIKSRMSHNAYNGMLVIYCVSDFLRDIVLPKLTEAMFASGREVSKFSGQTDFKFMLDRLKPSAFEMDEQTAEKKLSPERKCMKPRTYHVDLLKKIVLKTFSRIMRRNSLFFTLTPTMRIFSRQLRVFHRDLNECINALNTKRLIKTMPQETMFLEAKLTKMQINELKLLLTAVKDYVVLYNTAKRIGRHKEMFLSSLEEIIVEKTGGISCSASKMGQDRKGMQTLHTDAMLIYYQRFGVLPTYNDLPANRKQFVSILADLFLSGHQQKHADQNAPGAGGMKDIKLLPFYNGLYMIPKDVLQEINFRHPKALKEGAQLASLSAPSNPYSIANNLLRRIAGWFGKLYYAVG